MSLPPQGVHCPTFPASLAVPFHTAPGQSSPAWTPLRPGRIWPRWQLPCWRPRPALRHCQGPSHWLRVPRQLVRGWTPIAEMLQCSLTKRKSNILKVEIAINQICFQNCKFFTTLNGLHQRFTCRAERVVTQHP